MKKNSNDKGLCGNRGTDDYMAFCEADIGKTVFLTKEAAEKALKGGTTNE